MQSVTGPDGQVHKFPAEATPDMIANALSSVYGKVSPPTQTKEDSFRQKYGKSLLGDFSPDKVLNIPGFVRGLQTIPEGGAQLLTRALEYFAPKGSDAETFIRSERERVEGINKQNEADYIKGRQERGQTGVDVGRIASNVAATLPIAAMMPGAGAATFIPRLGAGVGTGAVSSALSPTKVDDEQNFWTEKAIDTGIGGAIGGAGTVATSALARAIRPNTSQQVKTLMAEGVTPTPGQILGGTSRRVEEGLKSVPLLGDTIKAAEGRALDQFNRAAIDRALKPLGDKLPKDVATGNEAVAYMRDAISKEYDTLLPNLSAKVDTKFVNDIRNLSALSKNLPADRFNQFKTTMADQFAKVSQNGTFTGHTLKEIESTLGQESRAYIHSSVADERKLGAAYKEAQQLFRKLVERSSPDSAAKLKDINSAFAQAARVEKAAGALGAQEGVFTPAQLLNSVKSMDKSARHGKFARGDALMQDLAAAGKTVLSPKVSDSGTPLRAMVGAGALGYLGSVNPVAAGAAGAAMLPYTKLGQETLATILARRPEGAEAIANALRMSGPLVSPGLGFGAVPDPRGRLHRGLLQ